MTALGLSRVRDVRGRSCGVSRADEAVPSRRASLGCRSDLQKLSNEVFLGIKWRTTICSGCSVAQRRDPASALRAAAERFRSRRTGWHRQDSRRRSSCAARGSCRRPSRPGQAGSIARARNVAADHGAASRPLYTSDRPATPAAGARAVNAADEHARARDAAPDDTADEHARAWHARETPPMNTPAHGTQRPGTPAASTPASGNTGAAHHDTGHRAADHADNQARDRRHRAAPPRAADTPPRPTRRGRATDRRRRDGFDINPPNRARRSASSRVRRAHGAAREHDAAQRTQLGRCTTGPPALWPKVPQSKSYRALLCYARGREAQAAVASTRPSSSTSALCSWIRTWISRTRRSPSWAAAARVVGVIVPTSDGARHRHRSRDDELVRCRARSWRAGRHPQPGRRAYNAVDGVVERGR